MPPGYTDAPTLALKELLDLVELQKLGARARAPERTCAQYIDDPLGFIDNCVKFPAPRRQGKNPKPVGLAPYQREIIADIPVKKRVAVRGPRGLGKSTTASLVVLWFALTRDAAGVDWKCVTTAGSWNQILSFLWPEIKKWSYNLRWETVGRGPFSERTELMKAGLSLKHGLATAGSPDQPEKLEGAHADSVLYIFDESKIIAAATFDAAEGAFSGAGEDTGLEAFALCISTPGENAGRFYEIHRHAPGLEDWHTRHVTLEEAIAAGRMTRKWANQLKELWGETSALYQNHVLGEFCSQDEDAIIPLAWIEAAHERWKVWDSEGRPDQDGQHTIGVDVARSGMDKSVAAIRQGDVLTNLVTWAKEDTMETVGRVKGLLDGDPLATGIIDVIGIGAGVYDRLREMGMKVDPFNAAKKTTRRDVTRQFGFMNCLTGDARVTPVGQLVRIYRARHEGPVFRVKMASGDEFTATPHHNVLTPRGWVTIESLHAGDKLCDAGSGERMAVADPDVGHMPPKISEIYRAAAQVWEPERVAASTVNFHGDAPVGEVEVVTIDRELLGVHPSFGEVGAHETLGGHLLGEGALTSPCRGPLVGGILNGEGWREHRVVPGEVVCLPVLFGREAVSPEQEDFTGSAPRNALLLQDRPDPAPAHPELAIQIPDGSPGKVLLDDDVRIQGPVPQRFRFGGVALRDASLTEDADDRVLANVEIAGQFVEGVPVDVTLDDLLGVKVNEEREPDGRRTAPYLNAVFAEDSLEGWCGRPEDLGQRIDGLAGQIPLDEILSVDLIAPAVHEDSYVYTLETTTGAYRTSHAIHRNCRSAAWWNLRELLDPSRGATVALPPDDELAGDLTALHKKYMSEGKIQAEAKDDVKKRIGRSTDKGDAVVQAFFTVAGSFHEVYGTEMCPNEKCGRGFARNFNGKPRDRCPYCATLLDADDEVQEDGELEGAPA